MTIWGLKAHQADFKCSTEEALKVCDAFQPLNGQEGDYGRRVVMYASWFVCDHVGLLIPAW